MSTSEGDPEVRTPETARGKRLRMLEALGEDRRDTEVLLAALQQMTAEVGGLGGMAHLGTRASGLGLAMSSGLPGAFTRVWGDISSAGAAAPARAVRDGGFVWLPTVDLPEQAGEGRVPVPGDYLPAPGGVGIASVALPGPDGPQGALSVLTLTDGERGPEQKDFFFEVARWTAERLRLTAPMPEGLPPTLLAREKPGPEWDPRTRQAMQSASVFPWEMDLRTRRLTFDEGMTKEFGLDVTKMTLLDGWNELIHPDDQPHTWHELNEAIRTRGTYDAEFRARRLDGKWIWLRARGSVQTNDEGEPVRMVGATADTTETHATLESVGRALRYMSDGFLSVDADWRIGFVNTAAEGLLGFPGGLVGRTLWDVPTVRDIPHVQERCEQAVASGQPGSIETRWPDTDRWYNLRLVPVPDGLTLYIADTTERRLREAEREAAARRADFAAQVTRRLSEAVSAQDVVTAVADSVLPAYHAAGLIIFALDNEHLSVVGSVGYPPDFRDRVHGMPVRTDLAVTEVLRARTPLFIETPEEHSARFPGASDLPIAAVKRAWAFLPLFVSGRPVGVAVVSFGRPRTFTEDERTMLTTLSGQIAQALERAGLYDAATTRARELQRGLLPRTLPSLPAVTAAARFLPTEAGTEVGGDWYDVIPLSADRVALVAGDVMGHGMSEAATMGRLRTAVHTLSDLELAPEDVLAHLNDLITDLGEDWFATCLYGIYDPVTRDFTYASAGHPPPAVVHPDRTVTYLPAVPDPPLGAATPPFEATTTTLPQQALLALYTDGLVESPDRDIDHGMAHLAHILHTHATDDLDTLCDTITRALLPPGHPITDDAALLITRTHCLPPHNIATWSLPEDPRAAREARRHVRTQLAAWQLEELAPTTELVVSELVGNVIRHAEGPIRLRLLRSRTLVCEISDASLTTPHIRHPSLTDEGGRGLQLISALTQRWGTRHTTHGKTIWTEQSIP